MKLFLLTRAFACICFISATLPVEAGAALSVQGLQNPSIARHIQLFEDSKNTLTVNDLQSVEIQSQFSSWNGAASALELGHSSSSWWLKIELRNDEQNPVDRVIEVANSHLSQLVFYLPNSDGTFKEIATGNLERFETRPVMNRYFVLPIRLQPASNASYFIKVRSNTQLFIPVNLWDVNAFNRHEKRDYIFQSFYVGVVLTIAIFSLFYFLALRDSLYLKYLLLLTSISFTVFSLNGLLKEFLPFHAVAWSRHSAAVGAALSIALLLNFMRHFLNIKETVPFADKVVKYWAISYPLPMFMISLFPGQYAVLTGQILTLSTIAMAMVFAVYMCFKRNRMAYFFTLGYSIPYLIFFINLLSSIKLIPQVWDVAGSTQVSFLVEMMVFSFALVDRTYQMRLLNETFQLKIIKLQAQVVESLREKENKLETLIAKRYKELRHLIDMLSHEVRTPMSILRMFIDIGTQKPELKCNAIAAINDIDAVIERCIETDQLEHGSIVINKEYLDVNQLTEEICQSKPDHSRVDVQTTVLDLICTDHLILSRIISNLLDNALKYSPLASRISIEVADAADAGVDGVQLKIANFPDAAGFPDSSRVFEKYYRSQGAHAKTGSGLGLYLVHSFAGLLGAKIAYSVDNQQVVFSLWIPR